MGNATPLFTLGHVLATPGALALLEEAQVDPRDLLSRHTRGDWGGVDAEDWAANDRAVVGGTRILSAYELTASDKMWVITEWDRSVTTMLLPSEY